LEPSPTEKVAPKKIIATQSKSKGKFEWNQINDYFSLKNLFNIQNQAEKEK
jgi:hypothetical protein